MGGFRKQGTATPIVHHCGQNEASRAEQSQEWGSTAGISSIEEHNEGERHNQTPPFVSPLAVSCLHRETHTYPCSHHSMTHAHEVRWSFVVAFHTSKVSAMPFGSSGPSGSRVRWVVRPMREHCPSCVDAYAKAHSLIKVESKRTSIVCQ